MRANKRSARFGYGPRWHMAYYLTAREQQQRRWIADLYRIPRGFL